MPAETPSYASQLNLIFRQTNSPELTFAIEASPGGHVAPVTSEGRLEVTTRAKASAITKTVVSNVERLLTDVELVRNDETGALAKDRGAANLVQLIDQSLRSPYGDQSEILLGMHGQYLVLRTNSFGHAKTAHLPKQLEVSMKDGSSPIVMQAAPPALKTTRPFIGGGLQ